jgi:phosphohistidine phosphatase
MAEIFSRQIQELPIIVSSPAKRAAETARVFAKALAIPEADIIWNSQIYEASAAVLLQVIKHLPEQSKAVALFGHNPGLTDLANLLTGDSLENIPTSGIYAVEMLKPEWSQANRQSGRRLWFDFPKNHI